MGGAGAGVIKKVEDESGDGDEVKYLNIIISNVSPYDLSQELIDRLRDFVTNGLRKSNIEDKNKSRTLEIEENCKVLGKQLRSTAFKNQIYSTSPITVEIFEQVLLFLCPGLWPFC